MSHPDIDYMVAMERRKDDLAAAEHSRLLKSAREAEPQNSSGQAAHQIRFSAILFTLGLIIGRGLYNLGIKISVWGCQLQVRYAGLGGRNQPAPCE